MACDAITLAQDGGMAQLNKGQKLDAIFGILCSLLHVYDPMAECDALTLVGSNPCINCLEPGQKMTAIFNLLCNIMASVPAGTAALYSGNGDPNGVVTAAIGAVYTQLDAPGTSWFKLVDGTNLGWAMNNG